MFKVPWLEKAYEMSHGLFEANYSSGIIIQHITNNAFQGILGLK